MQKILSCISNCACYIRRSRQDIEKEKRTGEDTLCTQRNIMEKLLSDLEISYVLYCEIGSGDKIESRPIFQQLLKEIQDGRYQAVAVKEISRLGRGSFADNGIIYDLFCRGLYIITPYRIYDPSNPTDSRLVRFELFFSREEFEMIKERLVSAKYNLASEGKWIAGTVPYGYRLNKSKTKLEIYKDEAEVVRLIFNYFIFGLVINGKVKDVSYQSIATYLTRMGIPSPRQAANWKMFTVKRILNNPVYTGTLTYRKTKRAGNKIVRRPNSEWIVVENAHEPVIEKELWDKAQEKIIKLKKGASVKLDFLPCELASLILCSKCGRKMIRQYSVQHYKKKDGSESIYRKEFLWCTTAGCTFVKYRDVEKKILIFLEQLKGYDFNSMLESYYKVYETQKKNRYNKENIAKLIKERINDLKRRLNFICHKYEEGIYDDNTFMMRKKELEEELKQLEAIIWKKTCSTNENKEDNLKAVIEKYKNKTVTCLEAYQAAKDKTAKNNLLHSVIDEIILTKTGKGAFDLHIVPKLFLV